MLTHKEIVEFQKKEREFLATPIGASFIRFKNAHFVTAPDEYRETFSDVTLRKHADAADAAEKAFRAELDKLMAPSEAEADVERVMARNATLLEQNESMQAKIEALRVALQQFYPHTGCPTCSGDCASANPPITACPMMMARDALEAGGSAG